MVLIVEIDATLGRGRGEMWGGGGEGERYITAEEEDKGERRAVWEGRGGSARLLRREHMRSCR